MTTSNGLVKSSRARSNIERIRERVEYLEERLAEKAAAGLNPGYLNEELAALRWALPICEAEGDALLRVHRLAMVGELGRVNPARMPVVDFARREITATAQSLAPGVEAIAELLTDQPALLAELGLRLADLDTLSRAAEILGCLAAMWEPRPALRRGSNVPLAAGRTQP